MVSESDHFTRKIVEGEFWSWLLFPKRLNLKFLKIILAESRSLVRLLGDGRASENQ